MNKASLKSVLQSVFTSALLAVCLVAAQAKQTVQSTAPEVLKVEPPNWWANHSINPVRLLIRGSKLRSARISSTSRGIKVSNVKINDAG
ncbi:MAG TPA: cyclomaltodextrinase N-terminal domain-containing protein, partial [Blastocatellia bacterium]|nr:cyclomaltodextrinase N-terminal domain-containing protein [Blastocatellia bacterium]